MLLFKTLDDFKNRFCYGRKWDRTLEAFEIGEKQLENVYINLGDSLVFKRIDYRENKKNEYFEGHRRYMDIHYILDGSCYLEINKKENLDIIEKYSDETDFEYFEGSGEKILLEKGNIILIENDEGFRFLKEENSRKIIVKLTVENNILINK